MEWTFYRYRGILTWKIPQVIHDNKEKFLEVLDEFNIDYIEELSLYSLNHNIFSRPMFSGHYSFDFENDRYTFTYYCYDECDNKETEFNEFMVVHSDWSIKETFTDYCAETLNSQEINETTMIGQEFYKDKCVFHCDEDDLEELMSNYQYN